MPSTITYLIDVADHRRTSFVGMPSRLAASDALKEFTGHLYLRAGDQTQFTAEDRDLVLELRHDGEAITLGKGVAGVFQGS